MLRSVVELLISGCLCCRNLYTVRTCFYFFSFCFCFYFLLFVCFILLLGGWGRGGGNNFFLSFLNTSFKVAQRRSFKKENNFAACNCSFLEKAWRHVISPQHKKHLFPGLALSAVNIRSICLHDCIQASV